MSGFKEDYNLLDKDIDDSNYKVLQMETEDKEIINKDDQNCSQKIDISTIISFLNKMKNPTLKQNLIESLKRFDNDGKKVISYAELINTMTILEVKQFEKEVDRMIREEKALIMRDLKLIIGIIAFSVVVSTLILISIVENNIGFEIVGKIIILLWVVGLFFCILAIIMSRRIYKKNDKIGFLIKEICSSKIRSG